MILQPEKVCSVIKATIVLHNFLKKTDASNPPALQYCPSSYVDGESADGEIQSQGLWRDITDGDSNLLPIRFETDRVRGTPKAIRERFCDFFINHGAVPWQENSIRKGCSN